MIQDLRTEYLHNPLGLDKQQPQFTWVLAGDGRGIMQSTYRVLVGDQGSADGSIWDSQIVHSAKSFQVGVLMHAVLEQ